jgi:glycogen debranching enzyme
LLETTITTSQRATFDERGVSIKVHIEPDGEWSSDLDVITSLTGPGARLTKPKYTHAGDKKRPMAEDLRRWVDDAPRLETEREGLRSTYHRSLVDLAALRFSPPIAGGMSLPAAGLPWFMSMFGRDSIITSLQSLPYTPELAATALRALGTWQGTRIDDFREEEPGRIQHEMRYGETAAFEEQPHSPYYGNADATALYVVLLDEYERWTGDTELVRAHEYNARAALRWIDEYADRQGNGYVSYQRANEKNGLVNQCWKDSWDSINYHDGRLPGFPRATCELQGYAYDAKRRGARLAREIWGDEEFARSLEQQAQDLRRRFNRDFWIEDGKYFAIALETDGT